MHRKLMVDVKRCRGALSECKTKAQLDQEFSKLCVLTWAHGNFICAIKELKDDLSEELSSDVTKCLQKCSDLYDECRSYICDKLDAKMYEVSDTSEEKSDPELRSSISQIDSHCHATSGKSLVVKRIELQKKRAELENMQQLAKAKPRKTRKLVEAESDEAEALAKELTKAKPPKTRKLAEAQADEAEALT